MMLTVKIVTIAFGTIFGLMMVYSGLYAAIWPKSGYWQIGWKNKNDENQSDSSNRLNGIFVAAFGVFFAVAAWVLLG